jgi:signal transduction histidine kinase
VDRLEAIIASLSFLYHQSPKLNLTEIKLDDFFQELLMQSESRYEEVNFILSINSKIREIKFMGDRVLLNLVFLNLIKNAYEAIDKDEKRIEIAVNLGEKVIAVDITDNGSGIPPGMQESIFRRYISTKKQKKGTGIGLDLCRNVVEAHGGKVRVKNTSAEGTTFEVTLPTNLNC